MVASLSNPAVRTTILTVGDQPPFGFDLDISLGLVEDWSEGRRWWVVKEKFRTGGKMGVALVKEEIREV